MFLDVSSYKVWRKAKKKNGTHKEIIAVLGTICFVLVRHIHQSCFFSYNYLCYVCFYEGQGTSKASSIPHMKVRDYRKCVPWQTILRSWQWNHYPQDILIVRSSFTSDFIDKVAKQALICGPTENFKTSQMRSKTSRESHCEPWVRTKLRPLNQLYQLRNQKLTCWMRQFHMWLCISSHMHYCCSVPFLFVPESWLERVTALCKTEPLGGIGLINDSLMREASHSATDL